MENVVRVLAGLGLVTVLLAYTKRVGERRCWEKFKQGVHDWVNCTDETQRRHPKELSEDGWKSLCGELLFKAKFSPLDIPQLLPVAVAVAKDIAAEKIIM
jgi:hypothetical protein